MCAYTQLKSKIKKKILQGVCGSIEGILSSVKDTAKTNKDLGM